MHGGSTAVGIPPQQEPAMAILTRSDSVPGPHLLHPPQLLTLRLAFGLVESDTRGGELRGRARHRPGCAIGQS